MLEGNNALKIFIKLHEKVKESGMKGYDPRLLWYLPAAARYHRKKTNFNNNLRRLEVAICRYFPLIIPFYLKLSKIPLVENPYGIGLLVQSYITVYKKTNDEYWFFQAKLSEEKLSKYLVKTISGGLGIAVPFEDPKVTNIPAGAEVALAYLELYEVSNDNYYFNVADKISYSFLNDHKFKKNEKGVCIDYYSNGDGMHVINANSLAMEVIYRVSKQKENNKDINDIVKKMFTYNAYYIENYEYLPYAGQEDEKKNPNWKSYDVYHTGFTLRSMKYICDHNVEFTKFFPQLKKAYKNMHKNFISSNGKIIVLKNSKVVDVHGVAEFLRCYAIFEESTHICEIILNNFNYMFINDSFYYQRGVVDSIFYMPRWGHAPMMLALAELL